MNNPLIYQMTNGTDSINEFNKEDLEHRGYRFLLIQKDNDYIGVFNYRFMSRICVEAHINILPEFHKSGYGNQAVIEGCKWFKENTECQKLVTYVPANCYHVLKFMKDNEFKVCGTVPEAVYYKNQLVNLYIFERGL